MKDVAYFLSSCLPPKVLDPQAEHYLHVYFEALRARLDTRLSDREFAELETEWRENYVFAWADFHRFLAGWSPEHWKMGSYIRRMTARALTALDSTARLAGAEGGG